MNGVKSHDKRLGFKAQRVPRADEFPALAGSSTPRNRSPGSTGSVNGSAPTAAQILQRPAPQRGDSAAQTREPSPEPAIQPTKVCSTIYGNLYMVLTSFAACCSRDQARRAYPVGCQQPCTPSCCGTCKIIHSLFCGYRYPRRRRRPSQQGALRLRLKKSWQANLSSLFSTVFPLLGQQSLSSVRLFLLCSACLYVILGLCCPLSVLISSIWVF